MTVLLMYFTIILFFIATYCAFNLFRNEYRIGFIRGFTTNDGYNTKDVRWLESRGAFAKDGYENGVNAQLTLFKKQQRALKKRK